MCARDSRDARIARNEIEASGHGRVTATWPGWARGLRRAEDRIMDMTLAAALGFGAGVLQALAYAVYLRHMIASGVRPNAISWVMWTFGTLVFLAIEVRLGVPASALILPSVCLTCSIGVIAWALRRGGYLAPERGDWAVCAVNGLLMLGYVWLALGPGAKGDAPGGADALGLALVSFAAVAALTASWPMLRTTYRDPGNERPLAWFVWSTAYGCLALAVMAEGLSWHYLAYPALCQVVHLLIGIFALEAGDSGAAPRAERGPAGKPVLPQ
jgi:cbb3-type cytochrome oxidase subunit 3